MPLKHREIVRMPESKMQDGIWIISNNGNMQSLIADAEKMKDFSPAELWKLFKHRDDAATDLFHYFDHVRNTTKKVVKIGDSEEVHYTSPSTFDIVTQVMISLLQNAYKEKI